MESRKLLGVGCGAVGLLVGVIITLVATGRPRPAETHPPEIGGQKAPGAIREIDFEKRYDVHCSFFGNEPTVFRGCKVVGFTGPDAAGQEQGGGSGFSSSREYYRHFDRWLILELSDSRLAYVPPTAIRYMELAKPQ